ncbi:MAG: sulfatase-like hydrolase/transferase [Actinomycetia bacterium]|nr:sulfatase-like hydrolase/transferase [Actinomycetes bacterium]
MRTAHLATAAAVMMIGGSACSGGAGDSASSIDPGPTSSADSGDQGTVVGAASDSLSPSLVSPNILLLIADDIGVESSVCYSAQPIPAPRIETLCANSLVFDNAWSSPVCSPTRAGLLTGQHSFRTGIGEPASPTNGLELGPDSLTLPLILDQEQSGYAHASFGKWHLGGNADSPNEMGWSHFSGLLEGALRDYENWNRVTDGISESVTEYSTTATVDDTLGWISEQSQPWFAWVGFNAPHTPFHLPPGDLHSYDLSGTSADMEANPADYFAAAVEALDTEIGRLLDSIDPSDLDNTVIIYMGDNGTDARVSQFGRGNAKGSVAEGGVHVPLMISGPGVEPGHQSTPVGTVDLFATVLELAGIDATTAVPSSIPIDSVSIGPLLAGGEMDERYLLVEAFGSDTRPNQAGKAIRDSQYKLVELEKGGLSLYDLQADPTAQSPLPLSDLSAQEQASLDELTTAMADWLGSS